MAKNSFFFYVKDVLPLIEKATAAGGDDLGLVITTGNNNDAKPKLKVGYFVKNSETARLLASETFTDAVDGCPYPPRCE